MIIRFLHARLIMAILLLASGSINARSRQTQSGDGGKIAAAWLAPDTFDGQDILERQVDLIATANLNLLWFSFSPELYLSVNATQADKKELNLNRIRNITRALKAKFSELNRPVPPIYIGVEITGNLRQAKINEPMIDMYGTVYDKIPAPFDIKGFWKPELLDIFDQFADIWEKDVGNGLPISGIFFDFEMYQAPQQASSYPGIADFSPTSVALYQKTKLSGKEFAVQLFKQGKLDDYFNTLKQNAYHLGRTIRNHIKKRLPHAQLAAYFPNLPTDWFYIGLFGGLSTPTEPLILATFNNSIQGHEQWLRNNKIYCRHLAAMLLSNFTTENSFGLIDDFNKDNDGIWYNRFSWLGLPYDPNAWWAKESTPLDHELVARDIGKHYQSRKASIPSEPKIERGKRTPGLPNFRSLTKL